MISRDKPDNFRLLGGTSDGSDKDFVDGGGNGNTLLQYSQR